MQTDPNWTNFLWNPNSRQLNLVDFGATRVYSKEFINNWFQLLQAAVSDDRDACVAWSLKLGYLTGEENKVSHPNLRKTFWQILIFVQVMLNAHIKSLTLLATPFKRDSPRPFSFGKGSRWTEIAAEIRAQIPVMLQHRLTPPPRETYSLNRFVPNVFFLGIYRSSFYNRKLSGAFLLASRLGATIDTPGIWDKAIHNYRPD